MKIDYAGREVVVTGGTGSLGRAVVEVLAEAGARCFIPCRSRVLKAEFSLLAHPNVECRSDIDLTRQDVTDAFYSRFSNLWASIHCVGGFAMQPFEKSGWPEFENQLTVNLKTCFLCCRAAVRQMRQQKIEEGGRIVNISSRPALEPRIGAGMVSYTCSKAAVAALTAALGEELAAEKIWVTAVAPSILDTESNRQAMPDADFDCWPKVDEVAKAIGFLASPQNRVVRSGTIPAYGQS